MKNQYLKPPSEYLKIKFDGNTHDINLLTFSRTLENVNSMLVEINKEQNKVNSLDKNIEVRIKALSEGSFEVSIEIITDILASLVDPDNVTYAAGVVTILSTIFGIRKFLGGKNPTSIKNIDKNNVEIKNNRGEVNIVENYTFNIYQTNATVNEALNDTYYTLSKDPEVSAFNFLDKAEKPIFQSDRSDFESFSEVSERTEDDKKITTEITYLNINKICWEKDYKWQFYYRGNKISASIKDETFFEKINEGKKFSKGDSLEVELKIIKEFSQDINTYINKSYEVLKVIRHIPRPTQDKFDYNN